MIIDRHVAKNAGTSVRTMFRANWQRCTYIGYDMSSTWRSRFGFQHRSFTELVDGVQRGPNQRFCVEAHVVARTFWADVERLHRSAFALRCRVVVMLRVREPLSWYRSFYDWAVLPRQRGGDTRFGENFTDWLPANLQSRIIVSATSSQMSVQLATQQRTFPPLQGATSRLWRQLMSLLRSADIVAPLERLDESLVLLRRVSGFLETTRYHKVKPSPVKGKWSRVKPQRLIETAADFCTRKVFPTDCFAAVRTAAPVDFRLHDEASRLFAVQLAPWLQDESFLVELRAHRAMTALQSKSGKRRRT